MHIAIIGAGNVGRALGARFAAAGHSVSYGVRDPADPKHGGLRTFATAEAAAQAELILLATPWPATRGACAGLGNIAGRIVIDATNPLAVGPHGLGLEVGFTTSGGEMVAGWCPGAAVFKTFNQTGFNVMEGPERYAARPLMFVAGDDATRKPEVLALVEQTGFEARDAGPLSAARLLEPHAMLWIDQAMRRGLGRDFAFALTRPKGVGE